MFRLAIVIEMFADKADGEVRLAREQIRNRRLGLLLGADITERRSQI